MANRGMMTKAVAAAKSCGRTLKHSMRTTTLIAPGFSAENKELAIGLPIVAAVVGVISWLVVSVV